MKIERVKFEPRQGGQRGAWMDWRGASGRLHQVFLEGGWFSGKTFLGSRKLLALTIYNSRDRAGKPTGVGSAMIGPTYPNMRDYMFPAFEEACEEFSVAYRWREKDMTYALPRLGTSVICRSAERSERITGWQVGAAWGDETARWREDRANPRNDPMIQLRGRIRHPKARLLQAIYTYTNEGDQTRAYEEARSGDRRALYRARTADNPTASDFHAANIESMTPDLIEQYLEGGAMSRGGSYAYALFENAKHKRPVQTAGGMPLDLALDFNINPGMHALVGQYHESHDLFAVCDELHGPRWDVRMCMAEFVRRYKPKWRWPVLRVFGDASGKSGWEGTGESCYDLVAQALHAAGIPFELHVPRSNPFVPDRVNAVGVALLDVRGEKHVIVDPRCERLLADLSRVRWDDRGKELVKNDPRYTHASDALGYWIHALRPCRRIVEDIGQMTFDAH